MGSQANLVRGEGAEYWGLILRTDAPALQMHTLYLAGSHQLFSLHYSPCSLSRPRLLQPGLHLLPVPFPLPSYKAILIIYPKRTVMSPQ